MWLILAVLVAHTARGILFLAAPTPVPQWSTVAWFVAHGGLTLWGWIFLSSATLGTLGICAPHPWQRACCLFPSQFLFLLTVSSLLLSDQWTLDAAGDWRRWNALTFQTPVALAHLLAVVEYVARGTPWGHRLLLYRWIAHRKGRPYGPQ